MASHSRLLGRVKDLLPLMQLLNLTTYGNGYMTMINTIQELENLIIEYRGDQNARIAIRECIEIIKKNEGK
jgi:hypothetical protein